MRQYSCLELKIYFLYFPSIVGPKKKYYLSARVQMNIYHCYVH